MITPSARISAQVHKMNRPGTSIQLKVEYKFDSITSLARNKPTYKTALCLLFTTIKALTVMDRVAAGAATFSIVREEVVGAAGVVKQSNSPTLELNDGISGTNSTTNILASAGRLSGSMYESSTTEMSDTCSYP